LPGLKKNKEPDQPKNVNRVISSQNIRLVYICFYIAFGIALLSLVGWICGVRILAGEWGKLSPMSLLSAVSFLLLSSALFIYTRWPKQWISRLFGLTVVCIVSLFALIVLTQFITGFDLGIERALLGSNEFLNHSPIGRMSPISAISFLLETMAFFILLIAPRWRKSFVLPALFILIALGINLIILIAYSYNAPLLYGGTNTPVALFTAITFVCIGLGQINLVLPGLPAMHRWDRTTFRGMLLRAFLPFILGFSLLEGWVDAIFGEGMKNPVIFHSLAALVAGVLAVVIIVVISERMGAVLEQAQNQISNLARFPNENPNPVLRVANDGRLLYANSKSQLLLRFLKCRQLGDVLPTGQRRLIEASLKSGVIQQEEISCDKIIYELVYAPVQEQDYVNVYGSDITKRKMAEVALFDSEEELQALFASMTDLVIIYDKEGCYLSIATTDSPLLIQPSVNLVGKTIHEVFPKEQAVRFIHHIRAVLETQRTMHIEYSLELDHNKVWFDASVSPLGKDTVIWVAREITERKLKEERSNFIGTHDELTNLYNRHFFEEELSRLEKSRLFPVSIFMIDIDDLKIINDTQGHEAGDKLLQRTAQILQKSFRPEDIVARIGGDEFVIVLPSTNKEVAHSALNRINHLLEADNISNYPDNLKISIGIATCDKQGSLSNTVKEADDRMYQDKRSKG